MFGEGIKARGMTASLFSCGLLILGFFLSHRHHSLSEWSLRSGMVSVKRYMLYPFVHISAFHLASNILGIVILGCYINNSVFIFIWLISHTLTTLYAALYFPKRFHLVGASGIFWSLLSYYSFIEIFSEEFKHVYTLTIPTIVFMISFPYILVSSFASPSENIRFRQSFHTVGSIVGILCGLITELFES